MLIRVWCSGRFGTRELTKRVGVRVCWYKRESSPDTPPTVYGLVEHYRRRYAGKRSAPTWRSIEACQPVDDEARQVYSAARKAADEVAAVEHAKWRLGAEEPAPSSWVAIVRGGG